MGLIGDRILVRPETREEQKTDSGIILPPTVVENNNIASGIVVMVGPGLVAGGTNNKQAEEWMTESVNKAEFIPLQIEIGYRVLYMPNYAYEIQVEGKTYSIMQQGEVLMYDKDPFRLLTE